jgi:hypothetical protein
MRAFWGLLIACAAAAQSPEAGRIERDGSQAVLIVQAPRPVDSAAIMLAKHFGMRVSVEDPPYVCADDKVDITARVAPGKLAHPVFSPRGGALRVSFAVGLDGAPADRSTLVRDLVQAANEAFPFSYRLQDAAGSYAIIPQTTRDQLCNEVSYLPLLDRKISIPFGKRKILESAELLSKALSEQTGLRVSCCQSAIAGYPWGLEEVEIGAEDEPARDVLRRLIAATLHGRPDPYFWLLRCDPHPAGWCFINLMRTPLAAPTPSEPLPPPSGGNPWFVPAPQ